MTTLIAVYNSEGLVGRCDARCYDAIEPNCVCICGGANHGAGKQKAMENTQQMCQEWIEQYTKDNRLGKDARWEIPDIQLALPL